MNYLAVNLLRKQRILRVIGSMLIVCIICLSMLNVRAFAATGIEFGDVMQLAAYLKDNDNLNSGDGGSSISESGTNNNNDDDKNNNDGQQSGDINLSNYISNGGEGVTDLSAPSTSLTQADVPAWSDLVILASYSGKIASDYPILKRCCSTASQIVAAFGEQSEYNKACKQLKNINWTYDPVVEDFTAVASGDDRSLEKALTKFKSSAANATATNTFGSIYDGDNWNPQEGVAGDFMDSVFSVVNVIFYVVSNLMLWFFLLQTGFDILYIVAEPVRPFIEPRDGNGGGGGGQNNGGKFSLSRIHVPICSHAVKSACGAEGGLGGNQAGGGSAGNAFTRYAWARFPVLICCAVYLILVTMGYWPKLIGWVSQFVVQIIDAIMNLGK